MEPWLITLIATGSTLVYIGTSCLFYILAPKHYDDSNGIELPLACILWPVSLPIALAVELIRACYSIRKKRVEHGVKNLFKRTQS